LLSDEVNEVLLVNPQGEILEGLSSNFFGVSRGVLFTADQEILPGITRAIVLAAAKTLSVEVCQKPVQLTGIAQLEEAFLTSASRAVLPVRQIDQTVIGSGEAGPVTRRLGEAFQVRIEGDLEEI
jgi:branched-chain amino acid aminotransferase